MPSQSFQKAYATLKDFEGGYANNCYDKGGETYAGISRKFWPDWSGWSTIDAAKNHSSFTQGTTVFSRHLAEIEALEELVAKFYYVHWWKDLYLDVFPQEIATKIFEQAVNLGKSSSVRYVQRLCNAFNYDDEQKLFGSDLIEDGAIGPKTVAALQEVVAHHSADMIMQVLKAMQTMHYVNVSSAERNQRRFFKGWLNRTK